MQCLRCQHEIKPTARFCESCGAAVARRCPSCGEDLGPQARFCAGCGASLSEREVTVLFVDIRGYTGFSEAREAEEIFHTVNSYTEMVSQVVRARGGSVVEFHGDGLLAVFGAPDALAMKDRAAVQVGCEIIAGMAAMAAPDQELRREGTPAPKSALLVEPGCPSARSVGQSRAQR